MHRAHSRTRPIDDAPTLAALGVLAFAVANVSHEVLGHGLATLAVGDRAVLLTTCYFTSSGPPSRWIPAAGGLMNLVVGFASLAALRFLPRLGPLFRFFLVLVAAFNLFFAFAYPAFSGILGLGDWAAATSGQLSGFQIGLKPPWYWRVLLVSISIVGYSGTMLLLARPLAPFTIAPGAQAGPSLDKARFLRIAVIPYFSAIVLACLAGALNPSGWLTMLTFGFPAAAASFGLTQMDHLVGPILTRRSIEASAPLKRSYPWIVAAAAVLIFFVAVLGPGIRFQ